MSALSVMIDGVRYIPEPDAALYVDPSLLGPSPAQEIANEAALEDPRKAFEQWAPCLMGTPAFCGDGFGFGIRNGRYEYQEVENLWRAWQAGESYYRARATAIDEWPDAPEARPDAVPSESR